MHTSDAPQMSDMPLLDWLSTRGVRANLLVESGAISIETVTKHLMKWFPTPFTLTALPGEMAMPPAETGTWFLQDVGALTPGQQFDLDRWLVGEGKDVQLVSISPKPLWPLVGKGQFLDQLYYRLNTIMLDASPINGRSNYDGGAGAPRS